MIGVIFMKHKMRSKSKFFKVNKIFEEDKNEAKELEKKNKNIRKLYRLDSNSNCSNSDSDDNSYDPEAPAIFAFDSVHDDGLATKSLSKKVKKNLCDSDDEDYFLASVNESVKRKFNCLGWVLANVTGILGNIQQVNILDRIGDVNNKVDYLSDFLQKELRNKFHCDVQDFQKDDLENYQKKVDRDPLHSRFIIVVGVGGGVVGENNLTWESEDFDYHFVKYFNGQWSQKIGQGELLVSKSKKFPETTWLLHQCGKQLNESDNKVSLYRLKEIIVRLKAEENLCAKFGGNLSNLESINCEMNGIAKKLKLYDFSLNKDGASLKYIDDEKNVFELVNTKDFSFFPNVFSTENISIVTAQKIDPSSLNVDIKAKMKDGKCIAASGKIEGIDFLRNSKFNTLNVDISDIRAKDNRKNLMPVVKIESYHSKKIFLLVDPIGKEKRPKLLKKLDEFPYKNQLIESFRKSMNEKFEL